MLTKNELAAEIQADTGIMPNLVKRVLDSLASIATDHVAGGNDLVIPGLVRFSYDYRAPQKKGSRWKKGDERKNNITQEVTIAESDSPPVTERIRLRAATTGAMSRVKPSTSPDKQKDFLKTKAAKTVRARKA